MTEKFHTLGGLQIPRGMVWVDEFSWLAVQKDKEYSTTGALLLDVGVKKAGRPITLQAEEGAGWISRDVLMQVMTLANQPLATHSLVLADGRVFDVQFDADDEAISAAPIGRPELPNGGQRYYATFKLITV